MKIIEQAKNILGSSPLVAKLLVNNSFSSDVEQVIGKLQLIAKVDCHVTKISYEIEEQFEEAHNNATENKTYTLGETSAEQDITITPLESQMIEFSVPVNFDAGSAGDSSVYSGDMALMNKFADKAKKISSNYKITASINIEGEENPIVESTSIKFS